MPKATKGTGGNRYTATDSREIPAAGKFSTDESESPAADEEKPRPKLEVAARMGFNKNQVADFQKLANNPEAVYSAMTKAREDGGQGQ